MSCVCVCVCMCVCVSGYQCVQGYIGASLIRLRACKKNGNSDYDSVR
jgi:hypothetical protein